MGYRPNWWLTHFSRLVMHVWLHVTPWTAAWRPNSYCIPIANSERDGVYANCALGMTLPVLLTKKLQWEPGTRCLCCWRFSGGQPQGGSSPHSFIPKSPEGLYVSDMVLEMSKISPAQKNWCFSTVVLEKTLESPLDCKEIQPVHPRGNQSWVFIGRTDAEAETPIFWPPDAKSWLIWKDPAVGKDWRQEKGTTEDEMVRCHHQLKGHEFG